MIPFASATMAACSVFGQKKEKAERRLGRARDEHGILTTFQREIGDSISHVDRQLAAKRAQEEQVDDQIEEKDAQIKKNGKAVAAIVDLQFCLENACIRYRYINRQVRRLRELGREGIDEGELQNEVANVLQLIDAIRQEFLST